MARWNGIRRQLNRFAADCSGSATVEFVIIAPLLFMIVFSVFESGWLMTKYMMLDRGLDLAVRDVRLGIAANPTHDEIRDKVCDYAAIIKDCREALVLEMTALDSVADIPTTSATCVDRTVNTLPVTGFNAGARSQIIYVRACAIVDPLFPGMGLGLQLTKDASGGFALLSNAVFVNEPG